MKRFCILIMILLTCLCACQPTPSAPIVQSKNDGKLEQAIKSETKKTDNYSIPKEMKEEYENGIITVKIDATVSMPDAEYFPVYRIFGSGVSENDVTKIINYFVGNETLFEADSIYPSLNPYDPGAKLTKSDIKKKIDSAQESLQKLLDKNSAEYKDIYGKGGESYVEESIKELQDAIADYSQQYKTAPDDITPVKVNKIWSLHEVSETEINAKYYSISAATKNGEKYISFYADTDLLGKQTMSYSDHSLERVYTRESKEEPLQDVDGAKYTAKQSLELAQALINEFDMRYALLSSGMYSSYKVYGKGRDKYSVYETDEMHSVYNFKFTPAITDNMPLITYGKMETYASKRAENVAPDWQTPYISITVDPNYGIVSYSQNGLIKFGECLNEGIEICSFDEITDITKRYIALAPMIPDVVEDDEANPAPTHRTVYISRIELSYLKIYEKGDLNAGLTIPAWCFYGTYTNEYADGKCLEPDVFTASKLETTPIFCVNAIDGSVIDLSVEG